MSDTLADHKFRIEVTCRIIDLLRQAIQRNKNIYVGHLVPNLTSVTDALTIPILVLREQVPVGHTAYPSNEPPQLALLLHDPSIQGFELPNA